MLKPICSIILKYCTIPITEIISDKTTTILVKQVLAPLAGAINNNIYMNKIKKVNNFKNS